MSTYSLALSDAGKTKIAIRFDEGDGILKYYKEFGSISCYLKGPPSSIIKVSLLDNTMKEICGATDSGVLAMPNCDNVRTDSKGDATFNCIVNKGCQAYDSMFFVIAASWNIKDEDSTMISAPFVSGSKGPAEAVNDKNRFRPHFVSYTSLGSFRDNLYFACENRLQKESIRITLQVFEGKELRMYYGQPSAAMFDRKAEAFYYKAKTRSQSHKLDAVEKIDPMDLEQKIREKLSTTAVALVQLLAKSVQRQQISESESVSRASNIPDLFNELFQQEFRNQNQTSSVASDNMMSPNKRTKTKAAPALAITPLSKPVNLVSFKVKEEPAEKVNDCGNGSASNKRNRTHFLDSDEWQSTVSDSKPPAKGRASFPRPKNSGGSSSGSTTSSTAGSAGHVKNDVVDFEDPRSPFYYHPNSRTNTITSLGTSGADGGGGELEDEEQFMNSQNSLLTTGGKEMFSRTGSINPHAYDDDTGDGTYDSGVGTRSSTLRSNSIRKGIANISKGFSIDSHVLDEMIATGQFDSLVNKDGSMSEGLVTRTNTMLGEEDMLFDSSDLLSRSGTLTKEGGAEDATAAAAVAAAANAVLEENRNKGINILITAIDKKAAHNARETSSATTTSASSVAGTREASVSVNNTQDSDSPVVLNVVPLGGEPSVTAVAHDSFVSDWMLTQSQ